GSRTRRTTGEPEARLGPGRPGRSAVPRRRGGRGPGGCSRRPRVPDPRAGGHGYRTPVPAATGTGPPCLRPDRTGAFWGPACAGTGVCWDRRVLGPACARGGVMWTGHYGTGTTERAVRAGGTRH